MLVRAAGLITYLTSGGETVPEWRPCETTADKEGIILTTTIKQTRSGSLKFLLMLLSLLLAGCGGETNQEVIARFRPQYDEMWLVMQGIAREISDHGGDQKEAESLSPQPKYVERDPEASNTEIVMYQQLLNPDVDLRDENQLDLILSNRLIRNLQWTGDNGPFRDSNLEKEASDSLADELEQSLKIEYLAVADVVEYEPAVALDAERFRGGIVEIDGYLVKVENREIVCSFKVSARPEEQLFYQVREGEDASQELAEAASSNLWKNARDEFVNALNEVCGGDVSLK